MHPYDAEHPELPVVQQVQVIGYTPKDEFFAPVVDHCQSDDDRRHRHFDSESDEGSTKDVDLSR
jgi:hypothetical protein